MLSNLYTNSSIKPAHTSVWEWSPTLLSEVRQEETEGRREGVKKLENKKEGRKGRREGGRVDGRGKKNKKE